MPNFDLRDSLQVAAGCAVGAFPPIRGDCGAVGDPACPVFAGKGLNLFLFLFKLGKKQLVFFAVGGAVGGVAVVLALLGRGGSITFVAIGLTFLGFVLARALVILGCWSHYSTVFLQDLLASGVAISFRQNSTGSR